MDNLYLFEAGATKTALKYSLEGEVKEMMLPAFNPNRKVDDFEKALQESVRIPKNAVVYFYGSGLGLQSNKKRVEELFKKYTITSLTIYDDILGAARAAFGDSSGVICIMGTGGLAAYFNGNVIKRRRGGYGYLIDDLGGGFELGRRIISAWLNGDFTDHLNKHLRQHFTAGRDEIIQKIYREGRLELISEIVANIPVEFEDHRLTEIIDQYFDDFLTYTVLPLTKRYELNSFSVVGGFGEAYCQKVTDSAKKCDLIVNDFIKNPVQRLFEYHSRG